MHVLTVTTPFATWCYQGQRIVETAERKLELEVYFSLDSTRAARFSNEGVAHEMRESETFFNAVHAQFGEASVSICPLESWQNGSAA